MEMSWQSKAARWQRGSCQKRGRSGSDARRFTVAAPAIANVILSAVGMRVRSLPITQAAVRKELQAKKI